ncbi:toprim domain-containing protein [Thermotoga sp.]|uniref:toprim domain-containing protein n=1 Tax=Thermotoga sp. TaxID=28240 RepID=UPI0025EE8CBF|nr:toprim domain-containing protein [Thermotoga sp.]MCD6551377.1 toprim domain-containing protein [Thermotoga sp.]
MKQKEKKPAPVSEAGLLEEILNRLDDVKEYPRGYRARCPKKSYHKHGDANPSFWIAKTGVFKCLKPGCPLHEGGHIRYLAEELGIEVRDEESPRDEGLHRKAIEYISKRLGFDNEAEARKFMRRFNIKPARFQGMEGVMIDLLNGVKKFRSFEGKEYRAIGKSDEVPFSTLIDVADPSKHMSVVVTEGTFDALTFWRLGIPAISTEGGHYSPQKVVEWVVQNHLVAHLAFDNDEAGREYLKKCIKEFSSKGESCYILPIPENYKDVNEAFMELGTEWLKEAVANRMHFIEWVASEHQHLLRKFEESGDPIYRLMFVKRLLYYYQRCRDPHTYDAIVEVFSRYGISLDLFDEVLEQIELARIDEEKRTQVISKMKETIQRIEEGYPLDQELETLKASLANYKTVEIRTIDQNPGLIDFEEDQPIYLPLLPEIRLYPSDILLISSPTKSGKTTLALNLAKELLDQDYKVLFVTYELLAKQIMNFFTGVVKGKRFSEVTNKDRREIAELYAGKFAIEEGLTIEEISAYVRAWQPSAFIIDYDQLIRTTGRFESEERRVSFIVQTLKSLALDTQSLCVLLSQENEEGQARWSREKEFFASVHLHLEKQDDIIACEVKLNRYGKAGIKINLQVDWSTRQVTPLHKEVPL